MFTPALALPELGSTYGLWRLTRRCTFCSWESQPQWLAPMTQRGWSLRPAITFIGGATTLAQMQRLPSAGPVLVQSTHTGPYVSPPRSRTTLGPRVCGHRKVDHHPGWVMVPRPPHDIAGHSVAQMIHFTPFIRVLAPAILYPQRPRIVSSI